jgi:hypothetical protein
MGRVGLVAAPSRGTDGAEETGWGTESREHGYTKDNVGQPDTSRPTEKGLINRRARQRGQFLACPS